MPALGLASPSQKKQGWDSGVKVSICRRTQQQPVRVREVDLEVQPEGLGAGHLCEDSGVSLGRADNR